MGATYILHQSAIANAANKNYISIYNGVGSGKTIRIWRLWVSNAQTGVVTGGIAVADFGGFTGAYTGGTEIISSAVSMDSNNAAIPAAIVASTNSTGITIDRLIRRIALITDEFGVSDATSDMLNVVPGLSEYLNAGCQEADVQPFILAEGEGFTFKHINTAIANNNAAGSFDITLEFDLI